MVQRAGARLGLGLEQTVVALAGPTGAGKSTLFNALTGADLAAASRRRPTTSTASAAVWGQTRDRRGTDARLSPASDGAALLDWLGIQRRHAVADGDLAGLVLLDLPDFDSVETSHRLEVDRLIELVDLLVWVVDPQKYADSAWHDRYLQPLAAYRDSMVVVLNQADVLTPEEIEACARDVERLLRGENLDGVGVLVASARRGDGLDDVRRTLAERVRAREAAVARLGTDVSLAAEALAAECGDRSAGAVRRDDREAVVAALADAAGVPTVVRAVGAAHRRRGALAAGWPFLRWLRRLRPDPLRRLRLGDGDEAVHTSIPPATPVQRAQVEASARTLAARAASALPPPWPSLARRAATARHEELADRLDRAVAGAELPTRRPLWWRAAGLLQRVLAAAVVAGALWLLALVLLGYLRLDDVVPLPEVWSIPMPTALLLGAALAGLLLAWLARIATGIGARRRSRAAARALRRRVAAVADELVVAPVEAELAAHHRLCELLETARAEGRRAPSRMRPTPVGEPV